MASRIYAVKDTQAKTVELVRAANPAAAVRHVVGRRYYVEVANQQTIVDLMMAGKKVLDGTTAQAGGAPSETSQDDAWPFPGSVPTDTQPPAITGA